MKSIRFCLIVALAVLACNFSQGCSAKTQASFKKSTTTAVSKHLDKPIYEFLKVKLQCKRNEDPSLNAQKYPMTPASPFQLSPVPFPAVQAKRPQPIKSSCEKIPFGPKFKDAKEVDISAEVEEQPEVAEDDFANHGSNNNHGDKVDDVKKIKQEKINASNCSGAGKDFDKAEKRTASDSTNIDDNQRSMESQKHEKTDLKDDKQKLQLKQKNIAKITNPQPKSNSIKSEKCFNETLKSGEFFLVGDEKKIEKQNKLNKAVSVSAELLAKQIYEKDQAKKTKADVVYVIEKDHNKITSKKIKQKLDAHKDADGPMTEDNTEN